LVVHCVLGDKLRPPVYYLIPIPYLVHLFYVEKQTMELPLRIVKPLLYTGFHSYEKLPLLDKSPCCRPVAACKIYDVQQLYYQTTG
jgi:hypothetical protein